MTVPVTLAASGPAPTVTVTMATQLGRIVGQVTDARGSTFVGAVVTVTDGHQTWTTTSTGPGGALPNGGFIVDQLQPGSYAVTATAVGQRPQTALVTVVAAQDTRQTLRLGD